MTTDTAVKDENIVWHQHSVDKTQRAKLKQQKPVLLWFTGLSGAGKSTIAGALENKLVEQGFHTYLLDGDNVRHGLCGDLGFSDQDRRENIRRIGELAKLMVDAGLIVLSAFISPHRAERQLVRDLFPDGEFLEVFVNASLDVCEQRDPKGLYKKARAGEIANFTGIDSDYEAPLKAEIDLPAGEQPIEALVEQCIVVLKQKNVIQ
ncbi:adenylyl-sulfate kinase [Vibrio renipiscarius]|uniref:Adenylyl-sulfate kinase n=1 Tax=Vibrio renipiscarius TaxID=1461322 RepID=A0A0C2NU18_9VIBR|nr:adenylyl-sulfate kinase [Vibrio renipiscarius]KII77647.1 adenylylsulfate kinase [Vibrio renipiscarius]KII81471.1 adenylylsulfate kinase [Vibrio renipiscarius]